MTKLEVQKLQLLLCGWATGATALWNSIFWGFFYGRTGQQISAFSDEDPTAGGVENECWSFLCRQTQQQQQAGIIDTNSRRQPAAAEGRRRQTWDNPWRRGYKAGHCYSNLDWLCASSVWLMRGPAPQTSQHQSLLHLVPGSWIKSGVSCPLMAFFQSILRPKTKRTESPQARQSDSAQWELFTLFPVMSEIIA